MLCCIVLGVSWSEYFMNHFTSYSTASGASACNNSTQPHILHMWLYISLTGRGSTQIQDPTVRK